jgi:hypothetical protein
MNDVRNPEDNAIQAIIPKVIPGLVKERYHANFVRGPF